MKPCCPSYDVVSGDRPLELKFIKIRGIRNPSGLGVRFDPAPPTVIPFREDEEPARIRAERLAKIHSRKQSGPDLDPQYLPSSIMMKMMASHK